MKSISTSAEYSNRMKKAKKKEKKKKRKREKNERKKDIRFLQVDRMVLKAKGEMQVQANLVAELKKNTKNVDSEIKKFKNAAVKYAAIQIVKVNNTY